MLRLLLLTLFLGTSMAHAVEPREYAENYARASAFERAQGAYELCEAAFANPASPTYAARIQELGQLWLTHPEPAYMALSTCQSQWVTKYLDPVKLAAIQRRDRAQVAYLISAADLLYNNLPEEIRLYLQILPNDKNIPLSPYEILSGMASSERQMHETLHREMRAAAQSVVAAGGVLATMLKSTKTFTDFGLSASQKIGRFAKQALLVSALAWGAGELTDYGLWKARHSTLVGHINQIVVRMNNNAAGVPMQVLLDEFYRTHERLGFFYDFNLYLAENGIAQDFKVTPCTTQVREFFTTGKTIRPCQDAASTWILAAQFLNEKFPSNVEARAVADRLMAKAKRAFWRDEEAQAYRRSLPVCRPTGLSIIFIPNYECVDPQSGQVII